MVIKFKIQRKKFMKTKGSRYQASHNSVLDCSHIGGPDVALDLGSDEFFSTKALGSIVCHRYAGKGAWVDGGNCQLRSPSSEPDTVGLTASVCPVRSGSKAS